MDVSIYIKSNFRGNPRGSGEAAAVIEYIDGAGKIHIRKQQVQIDYNTKNALLLKISITAMRMLLKPCKVTIYADCDYIANVYKLGWIQEWWKNGWKKADGKPPANVEEWRQFRMLAQIHTIEFREYDSKYESEFGEMLIRKEKEREVG